MNATPVIKNAEENLNAGRLGPCDFFKVTRFPWGFGLLNSGAHESTLLGSGDLIGRGAVFHVIGSPRTWFENEGQGLGSRC